MQCHLPMALVVSSLFSSFLKLEESPRDPFLKFTFESKHFLFETVLLYGFSWRRTCHHFNLFWWLVIINVLKNEILHQ